MSDIKTPEIGDEVRIRAVPHWAYGSVAVVKAIKGFHLVHTHGVELKDDPEGKNVGVMWFAPYELDMNIPILPHA